MEVLPVSAPGVRPGAKTRLPEQLFLLTYASYACYSNKARGKLRAIWDGAGRGQGGMGDFRQARERSVSNLQRLYAIVVGLAITTSLNALVKTMLESRFANFGQYYSQLLMFISFIATVVPFFHGANRYLDATYVTDERSAKTYALLIDFLALFFEGLALFALAVVVGYREIFYTTLAGLFVLDILWVASTNFTAVAETDKVPAFRKWATINIVATGAILLSVWSNVLAVPFWRGEIALNAFLVVIVVVRTVYDYISVWSFYYPSEPGREQIPAPRPAPPPHRTADSADSKLTSTEPLGCTG